MIYSSFTFGRIRYTFLCIWLILKILLCTHPFLFCPFSVRLSEVMKNEKTLWNNRKINFLMNAFGIKCRRNSHFYPKYENIFVCSRYIPLSFGMVQGSFVYLEKWEGTSILNYKDKFGIRIKQHWNHWIIVWLIIKSAVDN